MNLMEKSLNQEQEVFLKLVIKFKNLTEVY